MESTWGMMTMLSSAARASCFINLAAFSHVAADPTDVLGSMQNLANRACLVPVEP